MSAVQGTMHADPGYPPGSRTEAPWSWERLPGRPRLTVYLLLVIAADLALSGWQLSETRLRPGQLALFATFLGYNPMQSLLGPVLHTLTPAHAAYVVGRDFFPHLITAPFHSGLGAAFAFAIAANVIAAIASALTGRRPKAAAPPESLGAELAAVAGEGGFEPSGLVVPAAGEESAQTSDSPD